MGSEQPGQVRRLPGYVICVAIPEWDKTRSHLNPVRKARFAQRKLLD